MDPSLRPREQMRSDLIGFLLYAIAEDPAEPVVSFQKSQIYENFEVRRSLSVASLTTCGLNTAHDADGDTTLGWVSREHI